MGFEKFRQVSVCRWRDERTGDGAGDRQSFLESQWMRRRGACEDDLMTQPPVSGAPVTGARGIPSLRWWIGVILFTSTVINYIDRQTLSILAPFLKQDFHWT